MKLMELMIAAMAAGVVLTAHPTPAFADGPVSAYDGEQDLALAPNEQEITSPITVNGATEDPRAPASGTARAYWHGLQNGRAAQKQEDAQNVPPLPPLPADMADTPQPARRAYAGYPQAAQVQAIPAQPVQQRPMYAPVQRQPQVVYQPQPQYQQQPPVVVNVMPPDPRVYERAEDFGRAPSWRNRQDAMQDYGYDPYPPPGTYAQQVQQPVYIAPPPPPVYVQPAPVYVAQGYVPRVAAYQPYAGGYINYRGRGWSARMGW
jgi:hypothetical protein